jgi:hypothetical protein
MHHGNGAVRATVPAILLVAVLALAGCIAPGGSGPGSSSSVVTSTPTSTLTGSTAPPSLPTQTDTEWGRIWDAVPSTFPVIRGAVPATDTGDGAVSALLALQAPEPMVIAAFYRDALQGMGMSVSVDGPLEDGGVTVSGMDRGACAVQVGVRPAGSTNLISVLYGAGCPF